MVAPDEAAFRQHLLDDAFETGVAQGRWWLLAVVWPQAYVAVRAARRDQSPDAFVLRFDLTNYPADAPTATPWDVGQHGQLASDVRPKGDPISHVFRTDWEGGRALYIPCDRVAAAGHGDWPRQHPERIWRPDGDITQYLTLVADLLTSEAYQGV